jgi:hypothetical protein
MKWQYASGTSVVNSSQVTHTVTVRGPLPSGPVRTFTNTDPGTSWFRYDAPGNTWYFNLQTKAPDGTPYPKGTYSVQITTTTPGYPASPVFQLVLK